MYEGQAQKKKKDKRKSSLHCAESGCAQSFRMLLVLQRKTIFYSSKIWPCSSFRKASLILAFIKGAALCLDELFSLASCQQKGETHWVGDEHGCLVSISVSMALTQRTKNTVAWISTRKRGFIYVWQRRVNTTRLKRLLDKPLNTCNMFRRGKEFKSGREKKHGK